MGRDIVGIIEASYNVESDDHTWLTSVVEAVRPVLDRGLGMLAILYDASDPDHFRMKEQMNPGAPTGFEPIPARVAEGFDRAFVEANMLSRTCSLMRRATTGALPPEVWEALYRPFGIEDIFNLNGVDPSGHGCYLGVLLPKVGRLSVSTAARWNRVAAHLAAGQRVRRSLRARPSEPPEAVLSTDGRVVHAEDAAKSVEARNHLMRSARIQEQARSRLRRTDPNQAVEEWKGLIAARWTLLDHFESDGRRYLLARKNDLTLSGFAALTPRERCAVGYAALGHGNKLIAYEMGISASTVAVLLSRAARRLGAKSRADLKRAYLQSLGSETK
jgi:DNA-binding CsgD family transcriptional regulator